MTTYNANVAAANEVIVRKAVGGPSTVPTVGQIWPRGNRGAT